MFVVVTYDIADRARRAEVSSELENYGMRVQRSVFECYLDPDQIDALKESLYAMIDASADNVRFYFLCRKDRARVSIEGVKLIYRDEDYFMI